MGYENPYFRTDSGLYSVVESTFTDSLTREGVYVEDYWTGEKYHCFFRRNKDTNQTNSNISFYYPLDVGIKAGSIVTFYDGNYLVLNQETVENRVYNRSDAINADILISTYNPNIDEEIRFPAFAYDMTGSLVRNGTIMTVTAGDTEFMTGDNEVSRKLAINCEFEALGCYYKIVNTNFKTGICRIQASITQRHEEFDYELQINAEQTYDQGTSMRMTADTTIDGEPVSNPTLVWSSTDSDIISIDESGNAEFVGAGTCGISCHWIEHDISTIVYVEVVPEAVELTCTITGNDRLYESSTATYTAKFYQPDGMTEDTTVTPVWSLDVPSGITGRVTIESQSGNTVTLKATSNTRGNSVGLNLTDPDGRYSATKTISIVSWF